MSIELSADGSYTLFNEQYQESYHSLKDGASNETLSKHIYPAFKYAELPQKIRILDICFGLGYNTFYTLHHLYSHSLPQTLEIYSPEKDKLLLPQLLDFDYPQEIAHLGGIALTEILQTLIKKGSYICKDFLLEVRIEDALEYITRFCDGFFDIVYQDAFSPTKNPELWSEEYFALLYNKLAENGVITTYSQSAKVRDNAKKAGFFVYEITQETTRNSRIFCKKEQNCKNLRQK